MPTSVAAVDERPYRDRYLDSIAPANIVGRLVKFSKDGAFTTADDGKPIPGEEEFIVLADQTCVGWVRFNNDEPPDREMGLLYDNFVMPSRESLGDLDPAKWDLGLDSAPARPVAALHLSSFAERGDGRAIHLHHVLEDGKEGSRQPASPLRQDEKVTPGRAASGEAERRWVRAQGQPNRMGSRAAVHRRRACATRLGGLT
jgi:hypothetical protein